MTIEKTDAAFLCALALFPVFAFADDITLERFPDADSVSVKSVREVEYQPDGTFVDRDEEWVKVLTDKGRRDESTLSLKYSSRYGAARVIAVSIIGTNGVERTVDVSSTTKETTDNSAMDENIYDPMHRQVVCNVPGLKVGETIHYIYERSAFKSRIEGQWADLSVFEWECPILDSTFRVISPKELPLKKTVIRNPLGNVTESVETREDGKVVHTWRAVNSAQAFSEPDTPPFYLLVQNVQVSTVESWEQLSRWYWNLCVPHLAKVDAAISNKVAEIVADIPETEFVDRLRAIYKWVAQEVRYMGLTMEDTSPGYAPHDVDITFGNRYGVCRDKAALLVAMLRIAGVEAYPVLIQAGAKRDSEVPSPYFNHAIVAVANPEYRHADGMTDQTDYKYILMDPTNESSRDLMPSYLCNCSYLVARPDGETLRTSPIVPADDNALLIEASGTLSADGSILLRQKLTFSGTNDNEYRQALLRRRPEERRKVFESILRARFAGAELLQCEILPVDLRDTGKPLSVQLLSRVPEAVLRGETRDELNAPMLSPSLGAVTWLLRGKTSLETRKYPLVISSTASVMESLRISLDGNLGAALTLPKDRKIEGKYEYARTFRVDGDTLVVQRRAAVNDVEFSPGEYASVREAIKEIESAERERPVFGKNEFSEANVRFRLYKSETDLQGDSCWVVTNTIVKEILTYDGKKSSSELTFSYNPTWQSVEIVSATVSNRDGKVSHLMDREINEMDCAWASSAPRYPASKQMVVNLPSVEIGSVISYTVVHKAWNAPAPFYGKWTFDVFEPTDEYTVRVNGHSRTVMHPRLLKAEPMTAPGEFWRDQWIVSSNSFAGIAARLREAADVKPFAKDGLGTICDIRNWMVKNVRVTGPDLYEIAVERHLTDPEVVLKDHYASRLDFVRTMCALLRGAGFEADVVFSSANGSLDPQLKTLAMQTFPNVRAFAIPLCRVREYKGGWLWGLLPFGRTVTTVFVGTENEFTPVGASPYAGSDYFDPVSETFEKVTNTIADYNSYRTTEARIDVRENGAIDFDVESKIWGVGVGAFRKKYEEMLPEDRSRHFQELLGGVAQSASATGELETDTKGYPAKRSFSCYVPYFATVEDDTITVALPDFYAPLFPLTGVLREGPLCLGAVEGERVAYTVTFPEGYTEVEHLPSGFAFRSTLDFYHVWYQCNIIKRFDDKGRLVVEVVRERAPRVQTIIARDYFGMLKDWSRIGSSRSNRTIVVRRNKQ